MLKKNVDNTVFDVYTKESCYWAGFLAADGCIDINGTIAFELSGKDHEAVEEFKKFCKADHEITYRESTNAYRIRFVSKEIIESLLFNFSVDIDKTHNLTLPLLEESWQYAAYYRGFFDGDGCFSEFFNNRPTASYRVFLTSGSIQFLKDTLILLRELSIIVGGSIQKKATNCWHVQLGIKDTNSFLTWVYSVEGYKLSRKYDKYHNVIVLGNRATQCKT